MKNYIIYNDAGDILSTGTCPDGFLENPVFPGEHIMEGIANDVLHRIVDGKIVAKPQVVPAIDYTEQRAAEYPSLGELADAIYWQNRGNPAPMQTYLAKVDAVKAKYPKP